MDAPVALLIFNRPDLTARVFARIAEARPRHLFLIADGPRPDHAADVEKCAATRAVVEHVDWPCEVMRNYAETNLGCGHRPASGITWVLEHADRAIILEDDCVPHPTFFPFCDELLTRFAKDERVVQICGNNFQFSRRRGSHSYLFSRHNLCAGGWATWRRAWSHYDCEMRLWPQLRDTPWLQYMLGDPRAAALWTRLFDAAHQGAGKVDFWDFQWTFACWAQNGLSALPNVGLLSNLGFREDGTHTKSADSKWADLPTEPMEFPLRHPPCVTPHAEADLFLVDQLVKERESVSLRQRMRQAVTRRTPKVLRALWSQIRIQA